jgi:hypothetical protein
MPRSLTTAILLLGGLGLLMLSTQGPTQRIRARDEFLRLAKEHAELSANLQAALERLQTQAAPSMASTTSYFEQMQFSADAGGRAAAFDYYDSHDRLYNLRREVLESYEPRLEDLKRRMAAAAARANGDFPRLAGSKS